MVREHRIMRLAVGRPSPTKGPARGGFLMGGLAIEGEGKVSYRVVLKADTASICSDVGKA
jgi:hypothetical protein